MELVFEYGNYGSVEDYDCPLDGDRMANELTGVAADPITGQLIHVEKADDESIKKYGRIQGVAAYVDVKTKNALTSRVVEELRLTSTPDSEIHVP